MANKHGSLSIDSDNLFPIIKKWLYSDHDIFYRELISNGCDAITKLKKLDMMGEYTLPADFKAKISVTVDPEAKTRNTSARSHFPVRPISFRSTRTSPRTIRSSDISDWASTPLSW